MVKGGGEGRVRKKETERKEMIEMEDKRIKEERSVG